MSEKNRPEKGGLKQQLNFVGLKEGQEAPSVVVTAVSRDGKTLHAAKVDNKGNFELPSDVLKNAHRILIGPAEEKGIDPATVVRYRAAQFEELLRSGPINLSERIWEKLIFFQTCVTGSVRKCRRPIWWYEDLFDIAVQPTVEIRKLTSPARIATTVRESAISLRPQRSIDELIILPFPCQPICMGVVEVWRRTCCCRPWVIDDPRLFEVIRNLEDVVRRIPIIPKDPNPPDPPPDVFNFFFKDGSLDEFTLNAAQDLSALKKLSRTEVVEYVNARRYLFCPVRCSKPVLVAKGNINPDGRFNICWFDFRRPVGPFCHEEYAYVVKQFIFGIPRTIYNGVAANIWFDREDDARLTSYDSRAIACRDNGGPGTGAFVYLDKIGDTGSNNLKTPNATGWDRVAVPAYNDGLAYPATTPADAVGALLNRNWGGTLQLNYMFSEDMALVGAKYYRVSITEADDGTGNPVGDRHFISDGLSWTKAIVVGTGVDIVSEVLGPFTVGGENNLYLIPYDSDPGDWEANQYHARLNTADLRWRDPNKRHLVTLEVFDATGRRLRPTGTPATGLPGAETEAAFTFRRKFQDEGPTNNVPFAALTHMFWWDNQSLESQITHLNRDGALFTSECLFIGGGPGSTFGIGYRAYHPNEMFQLSHSITWQRGMGSTIGATGALLASSSSNVGVPPASPGDSPTNTFAEMLRTDLEPSRKKCAFIVSLSISSKIFDGDSLNGHSQLRQGAFVIEIV